RSEMPAAAVGVAPALDQSLLLELVEQSNQLAAVVAERVGDRALCLARTLAEYEQDGVVVGVEARPFVRRHRPLLGGESQGLQQERGGRDELLRQLRNRRPRRWRACDVHRE